MTVRLTVASMACSACAETISKAVQAVDASAQVTADPKTKLVIVETQAPEDQIKGAIEAAGYPIG